jgi:hypothetical protein
MARLRAKVMSPEVAYAELIERLNFALVQAGKPCLSTLGKQVDYSKATLSKVFSGKAMPSWKLLERLGRQLRVPPAIVQEWYTLWTAVNLHNRKPGAVRGKAAAPGTGSETTQNAEAGYRCPRCGCWVVDTAMHAGWHLQIDPGRGEPPPTESIQGWNAAPAELTLLRTALGDQRV